VRSENGLPQIVMPTKRGEDLSLALSLGALSTMLAGLL
jgi:hypothetical protein